MICYKDITFCDQPTCSGCFRKLTEQIKRESVECGLPISLYVDRPGCYHEKNNRAKKIIG